MGFGVAATIAVLLFFLGPYNSVVDSINSFAIEIFQIETTLLQTGGTLDQLVETLQTSSESLDQVQSGSEDLDGLLQSVSGFLDDEAPETIESARQAILSTQEGARAMDQVLRGLDSVSFLTGVNYDPEQPLDASLASVADSLSPLPDSLRGVSGDLDDVRANLEGLQETAGSMQTDLVGLQAELEGLSQSLALNAEAARQLADQMERIATRFKQFKIILGLVSVFLTLNFCAIQWVIWELANERAKADSSVGQTQPTHAGGNK
jgi:methyl-accepting chemotaxis protein